MNIALIGGTGFVGSAVLKELTNRGHKVTAIIRSEGRILPSDLVAPKLADVTNVAALVEALRGSDAVISAYNAGWSNPHLYDDFLKGARNIQAAAKQAGVLRYLVVGGAGSLFLPDGSQLVDSPEFPEAYKSGAQAARDYLTELQTDEQDLDWVFLSPPIEFNAAGPAERTGDYRVGKDEPLYDADGHSVISVADLAIAIVDEIEKPAHSRERFTVGY